MNINKTFLHRVPELLEQGLSFDEAIQKAYTDETNLLCEFAEQHDFRSNRANNMLNDLAEEFYYKVAE